MHQYLTLTCNVGCHLVETLTTVSRLLRGVCIERHYSGKSYILSFLFSSQNCKNLYYFLV